MSIVVTSNPLSALAEVKASIVHALGIFATVRIPKGTVWWRVELEEVIHIKIEEELFENYANYDKCSWANMYGEFGRSIGCWA